MKYLFVCLFSLVSFLSIGQNIDIPAYYGRARTSPQMFRKGDVLQLNADSIYLVNAIRMAFYKSLHQQALKDEDPLLDSLVSFLSIINDYEKELRWYDTRLKNYEEVMETILSDGRYQFDNLSESLLNTKKEIKELKILVREADMRGYQPSFWEKTKMGIPYFIGGGIFAVFLLLSQ